MNNPKKELFPSQYAPSGPIDPATWHFFSSFQGTLIGKEKLQGFVLSLTPRGPQFQVGTGANGKNLNYGASGWFNFLTVTRPNNTTVQVPSSGEGDINIDLEYCSKNSCE